MKVQCKKVGDSFIFRPEEKARFQFLLSDLSVYGDSVLKPQDVRGTNLKCMQILLAIKLDEFAVSLSRGCDFRIGNPYHSRKQNEPVSIEIPLVIPSNCGLKIFSVDAGFQTYIVNDGKEFINLGDDYEKATAVTHSLF